MVLIFSVWSAAMRCIRPIAVPMGEGPDDRWSSIPRDILARVFNSVGASNLASVRVTCKSWGLAVDTSLQHVKLTKLKASFLKKLTSVKSLDLSNCPARSGSLKELSWLPNLTGIRFSGKFPVDPRLLTSLKLTRLVVLHLEHNHKVRDATLTRIGALQRLQYLSFRGCDKLRDRALKHLLGLTELKTLILDSTKVTDEGLTTITNIRSLTSLSLHGCVLIRNSGLTCLEVLHNLQSLSICWCYWITDEGLEKISKLSLLKKLDLSYLYKISDPGIVAIGALTNLEHLNLSYCFNITDEGIDGLGRLTNLTSLSLAYCYNITTDGLRVVQNMTKLRTLNLEYCCNLVTGARAVLGNMVNLTSIKFPSNP